MTETIEREEAPLWVWERDYSAAVEDELAVAVAEHVPQVQDGRAETDAVAVIDLVVKLAGDAMKEAAYKVYEWAHGDLTLEDVDPNAEGQDEIYRSLAEAMELQYMTEDMCACMELYRDANEASVKVADAEHKLWNDILIREFKALRAADVVTDTDGEVVADRTRPVE